MVVVTYNGVAYECHKAYMGEDFVHLVDAAGCMVAAFDGVNDFSGFTITGGTWETPCGCDDGFIMTVGDDGVPRPSTRRLSSMPNVVVVDTEPDVLTNNTLYFITQI